jgi:hypothetical protein
MSARRCVPLVALFAFLLTARLSAAEPEWTPLFDGHSIADWVKRGGAATYRVEDGQIVGTTAPGDRNTFLCTPREYADFDLELDFKVDPQLNSGVQIRSQSVPGYHEGQVHGYQVEIDPSPRAFTAGIYDEGRRGWLADLSKNEAAQRAFKAGEWNRLRVAAHGPALQTWINDVPAADLKDDLTHTGFIGLQVHASDKPGLEVRWRNLRIRDLGDPWLKPPDRGTWLLHTEADMARWEQAGKPGEPIQWLWSDGALEVKPGAGNIVTRDKFGDARLHVEFMVDDNGKDGQANGNSGVYLQGRYEVQILNSAGQPPTNDNCGAIYKVAAPAVNMARPAGEWQTYDIWFTAAKWADGKKTAPARVTVYHNGTRIHDNVELPGPTGAGQPETPEPAPLLLQDHGNKVRFRNIWIEPNPSGPPTSQP